MSANPFDLKTVLLAKHAQHVVLMHFPIALFAAGVLFDFLAQQTRRRGLAEAAYFNFLVAAISTVPELATGILAWQFALEGQKLKGTLKGTLVDRIRVDSNDLAGVVGKLPRPETATAFAELPVSD